MAEHPSETLDKLIELRKVPREPDWLSGNLGYPVVVETALTYFQPRTEVEQPVEQPVQQSDLLRPLLLDIARNGLGKAYENYGGSPTFSISGKRTPSVCKHVIVVGAGMAGLVAAYELKRAGHCVTIVETQDRVGGRVKTVSFKEEKLKEGELYSDAGAMRLPGSALPRSNALRTHFLTDFYVKKFQLKTIPFVNSNDNCYLKFYGREKVKQKGTKWNKAPQFSTLWSGWDRTILLSGAKEKYSIDTIDSYYDATTKIITDQLRVLLVGVTDQSKQAAIWSEWIETWCRFPLDGFLRSTKEAIMEQIPPEFRIGLDDLGKFLPWPDAAITAYSTYSYTEQLDQSLVQYLRDQLGKWWSSDMHRIDGGMSQLPEAFASKLEQNITKNFTVTAIEYDSSNDDLHKQVVVHGFKRRGNKIAEWCELSGHAVIVTTPVHLLRQVKFKALNKTDPLPDRFYKAVEDIWYGPSTKIMIQSKTRFWEKEGIQGGFTKTNLPVGQIHYPSNPGLNSIPERIKGGILLCYTWKSEALMFGALPKQIAIESARRQIAEIHPEIGPGTDSNDFVGGDIVVWYNEPSAQGAYALLKPRQYHNVRWLMYPWKNLYFAGEAISFASGWIQGALESGMRAAYQFYARNEEAAS